MALLHVLHGSEASPSEVLPALALLGHRVIGAPAGTDHLAAADADADADVTLIDGRADLRRARELCRLLASAGTGGARLVVVTEAGMPAVSGDWAAGDVVLDTAGPAEVDARIRLLVARSTTPAAVGSVQAAGITIHAPSYSARLRGRPLDLTYKEFLLLQFLASHPNRAFTREHLLSEVWGQDYFGGTRTVDVHVRRLRAKLGDREQLIGTVRNVGYCLTTDEDLADGGGQMFTRASPGDARM